MSLKLVRPALSIGLLLLSACAGIRDFFAGYEDRTFTPVALATEERVSELFADEVYCHESVTRGTGSTVPDPAAGSVHVGFDAIFDPGTQPLSCEYAQTHEFRGIVRFNLSSVPRDRGTAALVAMLDFRQLDGPVPNTIRDCERSVERLAIADGIWTRGLHRVGEFVPIARGASCRAADDGVTFECNVSAIAQEWVSDRIPNTGFVLINGRRGIPTESEFGTGRIIEPRPACLHTYTDFQLQVSVPPASS